MCTFEYLQGYAWHFPVEPNLMSLRCRLHLSPNILQEMVVIYAWANIAKPINQKYLKFHRPYNNLFYYNISAFYLDITVNFSLSDVSSGGNSCDKIYLYLWS